MRRYRGLLLVGLLLGCAGGPRPEAVQAWVGRPAAALERAWGPPTRTLEEGQLHLLIYEEVERVARRDLQTPPMTARTYTPAPPEPGRVVLVRTYLFWVDRDGTIVRATVRQP